MKVALRFLLALYCCASMTGCRKAANDLVVSPLAAKVTAGVSGRITDETGAPVIGAVVTAGSVTATTDANGMFRMDNASLTENAAFVKVEKTGYFTGSRTFFAREGQHHYVEIQLILAKTEGFVNAPGGGTVTLSNGSAVTLPGDAIINKATGAAYAGQVRVAAAWLDPTAANLWRMMPGDLQGVDEKGERTGLATYGMMAVELTGAGGEKLQIAPGKKATLKFPIPASMQAAAPASIPLWYFDESAGLWKREGAAARTGNFYEAGVGHFSFWNCDATFPTVEFSARFKDQAGQPLAHIQVRLSRQGVTGLLVQTYGYTDSTGYVKGLIPQNEPLLLEIFETAVCATPLYSMNIGPFATTAAATMGSVTATIVGLHSFTLAGTAVNCAGAPVTNGFLEIKTGSIISRAAINGGSFNMVFHNCSPTQQVTYYIVDNNASMQSVPVTTTVNAGVTALGSITACTPLPVMMTFALDGMVYTLAPPKAWDTVYSKMLQASPGLTEVVGLNSPIGTYLDFYFSGAGTGSFPLTRIYSHINDTLTVSPTNPVMVNITEYGPVGGYISGNFSGTLLGRSSPTHTIQCTFRSRRKQ